jgi:hypothetical protein
VAGSSVGVKTAESPCFNLLHIAVQRPKAIDELQLALQQTNSDMPDSDLQLLLQKYLRVLRNYLKGNCGYLCDFLPSRELNRSNPWLHAGPHAEPNAVMTILMLAQKLGLMQHR